MDNIENDNIIDNEDQEFFTPNKPSIIDLYAEDGVDLKNITQRLQDQTMFEKLEIMNIKDGIVKIKLDYKGHEFTLYLKIISYDNIDLTKINKVLIDDEVVKKASKMPRYIKSFVDAKHHYVEAYYAQIKLLSILSDKPVLIVDCTQWCIYSADYLKQFAKSQVDIIDSNLYKVKVLSDGTIYTEGLERFGIKDVEMAGLQEKYIKSCAAFLSQLARYFIENGQIPNSCKVYSEVFENPFYACLVDIEDALEILDELAIVESINRDEYLNNNKLYVSVHSNVDMDQWYLNDKDVLNYLDDNTTYYTSTKHFEDEKILAQETIAGAINFLTSIDDASNMMILARNEEINTDWYYFDSYEDGLFKLKTESNVLHVKLEDILNWNYRGLTPLYAYSLSE